MPFLSHRPLWGWIVAFCLCLSASGAFADTPNERIQGSAKILEEMRQQSDVGAMASLVKGAKGVAIFPSVVNAGLVFGGRYGEGLILRHNPATGAWYGPSFLKITGISWGLQIGVQSTALVLVITNDRGMERFAGDKVTLGGDLAVAAGPVGRHTEAATDINLKAAIYSYSISKGLFAGIALEGADVATDDHANRLYWGSIGNPRKWLSTPAHKNAIQPVVLELNRLIQKAED